MDKEIEQLCDREIQYLREILSQLMLEQELLLTKNFVRQAKIHKALSKTHRELRAIITKRNQLLLDKGLDAYYTEQIQLLQEKIGAQKKENLALIKQINESDIPTSPLMPLEAEEKKGPSLLVKEEKPLMD